MFVTGERKIGIWFEQNMLFLCRFGIEQEFTLLQKEVKWPLGWPVGGFPAPQVS